MGDEHFGERRFLMDHPNDADFLQPDDDRIRHGRDRRHAPRLSGKTSFTEEVLGAKNGHHGFLALLRNDETFTLPFWM
jgi:hypothetical protein